MRKFKFTLQDLDEEIVTRLIKKFPYSKLKYISIQELLPEMLKMYHSGKPKVKNFFCDVLNRHWSENGIPDVFIFEHGARVRTCILFDVYAFQSKIDLAKLMLSNIAGKK